MKKTGIGVIGCGSMGRGLVELLLKKSDRLELRAVYDPDKRSVRNTLQRLSAEPKIYSDYRDLVCAKDVDWVMIASWNCFHKDHTIAAFKAGKDVFCQKPLATNLADCIAMKKAQAKTGRRFNIGFTLRYSPHYRKIRELIEKKVIGDIISLEFNETLDFNHGAYIMGDWRRRREYAGTHLLEKCSHDIDLVNWMVGSKAARVASFGGLNFFVPENKRHIRRVGKNKNGKSAYRTWRGLIGLNPFTSDKDIVDNQVAIIEFENNVRASFHTNLNSAIRERRMYICGSEGTIQADVMKGDLFVKRIGFDTAKEKIKTNAIGGHGGGDDILAAELVESMLASREPSATLDDGLKSAITCFAIDKAMDSGKVVNVSPYWKKADL